jgi:hypothetical protein
MSRKVSEDLVTVALDAASNYGYLIGRHGMWAILFAVFKHIEDERDAEREMELHESYAAMAQALARARSDASRDAIRAGDRRGSLTP